MAGSLRIEVYSEIRSFRYLALTHNVNVKEVIANQSIATESGSENDLPTGRADGLGRIKQP